MVYSILKLNDIREVAKLANMSEYLSKEREGEAEIRSQKWLTSPNYPVLSVKDPYFYYSSSSI